MTTGKRYEDEEEDAPRKIPLGVMVAIVGMVLTMLGQTVGIVYWLTTFKTSLEGRVTVVERLLDSMALTDHRLTILESNYISINSSLSRIENKLDDGQPARGHSP